MKKLIIIILIIAGAITATFFIKPSRLRAPTERPITTDNDRTKAPQVSADYVIYYGMDGKNAFQLLQETANIEFKKYDFGVFVESIGSIKPDAKHFWKLYVNGKESQVGADSVMTKNGDTIEWRLEQITE